MSDFISFQVVQFSIKYISFASIDLVSEPNLGENDMNPARCARDSWFVYGSSTELGSIVDRLVLERLRKIRSISRQTPQDKFLCQRDKFSPMLVVQGKSFGTLVNPRLVLQRTQEKRSNSQHTKVSE